MIYTNCRALTAVHLMCDKAEYPAKSRCSVFTEKIPLLMCTLHQEGIFYFVPDKKVLRISTIVVNIYLKYVDT